MIFICRSSLKHQRLTNRRQKPMVHLDIRSRKKSSICDSTDASIEESTGLGVSWLTSVEGSYYLRNLIPDNANEVFYPSLYNVSLFGHGIFSLIKSFWCLICTELIAIFIVLSYPMEKLELKILISGLYPPSSLVGRELKNESFFSCILFEFRRGCAVWHAEC